MTFLKSLFPIVVVVVIVVAAVTFQSQSEVVTISSPTSPSATSTTATSTTTLAAATASSEPVVIKEDPAVVSKRKLTAAGANLLGATVNILCTTKSGNTTRGTSATGVIIDPRGLILTVAHVGQYYLLMDEKSNTTKCVIRTGGPATDAYTAELAYLSPSWLWANPETLIEKSPKGTGEHDFAVLVITESATKDNLPPSFPFVPFGTHVPSVGEKVAVSGYAAQYLDGADITSELYPTIVFDYITNRYTLGENTVDVLSIQGTAAAQEGSSGGGLVDEHNQLVGLITTSSIKGELVNHTLNAIVPRHIRESFEQDTGQTFDTYFASHDVSTLADAFSAEREVLSAFLKKSIGK